MSKPIYIGLHTATMEAPRHSSGAYEGITITERFTADTDAATGAKVLRLRYRPAKQSVHGLASPIVTKDPDGTPVVYAHGVQTDTEGPSANTCFIDYVAGIIRVPDATTTEVFTVEYNRLECVLRPADMATERPDAVLHPSGSPTPSYHRCVIPLTDSSTGLLPASFLYPLNLDLATLGSTALRPLIQSGYPTDASFNVYIEDDGSGTSAVNLVWGAVWVEDDSEWNPDAGNTTAYRLQYKPHDASSPLLYICTHGGSDFVDGSWVLVTREVWVPIDRGDSNVWVLNNVSVNDCYWQTSTDGSTLSVFVPGQWRTSVVSGVKLRWINATSSGITEFTVNVYARVAGGTATLYESVTVSSSATTEQEVSVTVSPAMGLTSATEMIVEIVCDDKAGGTLKVRDFRMVTT